MAGVTAEQVKELRERTGAGFMECKKALQEANGDIEAAIEAMRKLGIAKAAKKADRTAAEGIVVIQLSTDQKSGVILEINCETDFVARDQSFTAFSQNVATKALSAKVENVTDLLALPYQTGNQTIEQARQELVAKLGENIQIRRLALMKSPGIVGAYKHGNRIGVLVDLNVNNPELGKDLAMHIAASHPQALAPEDVPSELIAKEREVFAGQAKASGKPAAIVEKMIEGRIKKFLSEISLLGQPFVKNPDESVAKLLQANNAKVLGFIRFQVGEGIEKRTDNFAQEVMAQVRGSL
jgi:elongation factor Ts